jgi:N-methylhydantoinase B/oxoprolinase/acetone carboxylase alpha subunit
MSREPAMDPILLEILWTRLISIVDEAAATFVRTAFSTLAREANDFAVVLTDAQGRSVVQSSISIPSFIVTRRRVAPPGLAGGKAGLPGRLSINEAGVDPAEHIVLKPGDRVTLETAGGGGWGAPA